jgi:hypothetical protein
MDHLTAPSLFVDVYQKLCLLLTEITNLAPSYRRMAESLNNGESKYTLKAADQLRKKLVSVQREITTLSDRIEQWGLQNDPAVTKEPHARELLVHRNIRVMAINLLHETLVDTPDIPSAEEYAELARKFKERSRREIQAQKERISAFTLKSSLSNAALGSFDTDSHKSTDVAGPTRRLKTSSSFSGLRTEDGWTPEQAGNPFNNPFLEDESELHPIQQQYLNIKNFLKQAAQAGRLEEVEILEKSLQDLDVEMKKMELDTPRGDT